MRPLLTLVFLISYLYATAQTPINGDKKYLGQQFYNNNLLLDTNDFSPSDGRYLTIDTTGMAETGYSTIILDTVPTGGGSGDVDGPASATDDAVARFNGTTGKLIQNSLMTISDVGLVTLTPSSPIAIDVDGDNKSMFFDGGVITSNTTDFTITSVNTRDITLNTDASISLQQGGSEIINVATTETRVQNTCSAFVVESDDSNPSLSVDQTGPGYVGIRQNNPTFPLHIDCQDEDCISLISPSELAPGAGVGTLTNLPAGISGDPDKYIILNLGGTRYILSLYQVP